MPESNSRPRAASAPRSEIARSGAVAASLILLAMLAAMAVTGYGLAQQEWPAVLPFWRFGATTGYLAFIACSALAIGMARIAFQAGYFASTGVLVVAIALVGGGLTSLVVVLYFLAASWSLGYLVTRALCRPFSRADEAARALVGAGLWATAVSLSAHFEVNYGWVYAIALALPVIAARRPLASLVRKIMQQALQRRQHRRQLVERSLLGALVLTYFAFALLPELAYDPLAIHLFVPGYVEANHTWNFDPGRYVWTLMPMLADWAYTIGYLLGGESAARLVNLAFLLACAHLVRQMIRTLGGSGRGADWGALVLLSTPLTFLLGSALYTEPFWSAYLLAGALVFFRMVQGDGDKLSQLTLAALLLAFSVASKAVALAILPIVFALLIPSASTLLARGNRVRAFRAAGLFVALASIPYLIAYVVSGNPVFPFFNGIFESPLYPVENFSNRAFQSEIGWDLPYLLVFFAERFTSGMTGTAGAGGFQWLLLLLPGAVAAVVLRNGKAAIVAAICLMSLLVVFSFQTFLRYVFPAYLFLSALAGLALSDCLRNGRALGWGMVGLATLTLWLNILFFGSCSANYRDVPVLELFDPDSREAIVLRRAPMRKAVELADELNKSRSPVAFLAQPLAAGLTSDALFANWYNKSFQEELRSVQDMGSFVSLMQEHGVRYLMSQSAWRGQREEITAFIDQAFRNAARVGPVTVFKLDDSHFFPLELLEGTTGFSAPSWLFRDGTVVRDDGTLLVTAESPISQTVPVVAGHRYLNRVTARCAAKPAKGRLQVNWRDADWNLLGAEIMAFNCRANWTNESQEVVAPQGAAIAVVFGSGHTATPIRISEISFRSNEF